MEGEDLAEGVIGVDFADDEPGLAVFIGVGVIGAEACDGEHAIVRRAVEIHAETGRDALRKKLGGGGPRIAIL